MKVKNRRLRRALRLPLFFLLAAALALAATSCGSGSGSQAGTGSGTKLPPGAEGSTYTAASDGTESTQAQATSSGTEGEEEETATTDSGTTKSADLVKTVYLSGANIAVVSVSREDSNKAALTSGTREVDGDFLLVELSITNVGDELVDLSKYSFRLWNPAIDAGAYEDFYGSDGTFGAYLSENMIAASLLDYETLQPVSYSLRIGETVDDIMVFFDLNPLSTAKNEGVTMEGTNLVIYDTETGDKAEINLSGYAG